MPNLIWNADNAASGAAGLKSSTRELVKFMKANMKASTHRFGQQLHLAQTIMHIVGGSSYWGADVSMGLGWFIIEDDANTFHEHGGTLPGFSALLIMDLELDIGVVVLSNTGFLETPG